MVNEMKGVGEGVLVNAMTDQQRSSDTVYVSAKPSRECWNCGRRHHSRKLSFVRPLENLQQVQQAKLFHTNQAKRE